MVSKPEWSLNFNLGHVTIIFSIFVSIVLFWSDTRDGIRKADEVREKYVPIIEDINERLTKHELTLSTTDKSLEEFRNTIKENLKEQKAINEKSADLLLKIQLDIASIKNVVVEPTNNPRNRPRNSPND